MERKPFWKSKTIWINVIALVILLLQSQLGFKVSSEEAGAVLACVNLFLRAITGKPLE